MPSVAVTSVGVTRSMNPKRFRLTSIVASAVLLSTVVCGAQTTQPLALEQRRVFAEELNRLEQSLAQLKANPAERVDAMIFHKGVTWALRYDREFKPADLTLLQQALARGRQRAEALAVGERPWNTRRGKSVLGYVSRVDGSVQPYGLVVPSGYDPAVPIRLDVILHGSTRPVGMSELRFMSRFDEGDTGEATGPDQPYIELHPLGRVENCYRWAGETDVFEAIEDVCRRYSIDRECIVLRGMSMGASGTWHLGLTHPDRFVALGPYCGYVDTHRFSETPLPNFVRVGPLPDYQELGLHMLDSVDYAANAHMVPAIACMGEKDVFFQAHEIMGEAMRREGMTMVNLISPGTGHVVDPVTHAEQMRRIAGYAAEGIDLRPRELRFVTWTLKYGRCHWLQILGLERHYARAEFAAKLNGEVLEIAEPKNITRFAIAIAQLLTTPTMLKIESLELPLGETQQAAAEVVVQRLGESWRIVPAEEPRLQPGKRPGLQGPIDDAFTQAFLCVRGTGKPWNAAAEVYSSAALKRFADEWPHYFRGELPVKDDTSVTDEDIRTKNLILFGDPGSNALIAKSLPSLPLEWNRDTLRLGGRSYSSAEHLPALIAPNPLPGGGEHYVVLNSGHTFHEAELVKLNYLLFPRWGDWAVLKAELSDEGSQPLVDRVEAAGYFNESWQGPLQPSK
jgi:pimeloyl-ACP methyl ester carboxylesterase